MRTPIVLCAALVAAAALGGCKKVSDSATDAAADEWSFGGHPQGRFVGVGIYSPGDAWRHMAGAQQPGPAPTAAPSGQAAKADPSDNAKTANDQAVIVVVDSRTGEVRACGDLSGYCVGMNPWKAPLPAAQQAPIQLVAPPAVKGAPAKP